MVEHRYEIVNNLPLLTVPMPAVKSVTALVLVNAGSRYETEPQAGIAHFFEHMVFKGTEKYPDPQTLASTIDAIGAEFNAFTSKEYTGYYVKSASNHLAKSIDVLSDMLLKPALRQEDIDREKGVIIEEINMYKDTPMYHVANVFEQLMYEPFGLQHDIIGTKDTVSSLKSADFREFLSKWYGLPNMIIILAGDAKVVDDKAVQQMVAESFQKKPEKERIDHKAKLDEYMIDRPFAEDRLKVEKRDTEQSHLVMGWPGLKRSTELRPIMSVLSTVLGGNMSSRLFSEVREKRGLCYYVRSDVDYYHETGVVGASAGVDPKRALEAVEVIIDEFNQVGSNKKPITDEELTRAKEYIRGTMTLSFENSKSVAQYFGMKQLLLGKAESLEETLAKIDRVTIDDLQQLAKKLFSTEKPRLAIVGPHDDQNNFQKLID